MIIGGGKQSSGDDGCRNSLLPECHKGVPLKEYSEGGGKEEIGREVKKASLLHRVPTPVKTLYFSTVSLQQTNRQSGRGRKGPEGGDR